MEILEASLHVTLMTKEDEILDIIITSKSSSGFEQGEHKGYSGLKKQTIKPM